MKHGMHGYTGPGVKQGTGVQNNSYRDSPAKTRPGANRHGFSKNPRQASAGRQVSDPFPVPYDSVGPMPGPRTRRGRG